MEQQGDAAFWWNLKRSGDGDDSTRHAGCPVLVGSKWGNIMYLFVIEQALGQETEQYFDIWIEQT